MKYETPLSGLRRRDNPVSSNPVSEGANAFGAALIYRALAREDNRHPHELAADMGAPTKVIEYLKANEAGALTATQTINVAFVESLRPFSALDGMAQFMVPAMAHSIFSIKTSAWTGSEVGEGSAKPNQTAAFTENEITPTKAVAMTVATKEFLEQPIQNVAAYISRSLRDAVARKMNSVFFAAVEGVVAGQGQAAGTIGETLGDIRELVKMVSYGEGSELFLFVSPDDATWLSSMAMSVGNNDMTPTGGRFMGLRVMVCDSLPANMVFCVDATGLAWWDGGAIQSTATHADIEASTAPLGSSTAPTSGTAGNVSLWMTNSRAFKVERRFGFKVVRPNAVANLTGVNWGELDSPIGSGS